MAKVNTYCCDQCGKQKQSTNHWWIVFTDRLSGGIVISRWSDAGRDEHDPQHFCGQACVIAAVQQWMGQ